MGTRLVIGVLGGMGPLATVDLYRKIIAATPATRDQEHLHVIIDADPSVPDRTEALLHGGADPTPWLIAGARRLVAAGVSFIVMPCNTAHAFLARVQAEVAVPFLDMVDETADRLAELLPAEATVGLLATTGTVSSGLYHRALGERRLRVIAPPEEGQAVVSSAIAAVKAGQLGRTATDLVRGPALELVRRGAQAVVAACTELPLVLREEELPVPLVDPTRVLAEAAVALALGRRPLPTSSRELATRYAR
jgi:aspartate racemase